MLKRGVSFLVALFVGLVRLYVLSCLGFDFGMSLVGMGDVIVGPGICASTEAMASSTDAVSAATPVADVPTVVALGEGGASSSAFWGFLGGMLFMAVAFFFCDESGALAQSAFRDKR